jgi:KUP system potassium uptake protein
VSIKYVGYILRADNKGEGGTLALVSLITQTKRRRSHINMKFVSILGIIGLALFYGDGVITPAISVLGALQGVAIAHPNWQVLIVPGAVILLVVLFWSQKRGSGSLGRWFGPVILSWFIAIALLGMRQIVGNPHILFALNPYYAIYFIAHHGALLVLALGGVVLAITGAEAMYADLGHFSRSAIRLAWFTVVFPALILNYMGQGALLLGHPQAITNPFYLMMPHWMLYPMIALATLATIIASQAVISGVFSVSWQAIQLGYFPKMRVRHTSSQHFGQVVVPLMSFLMLISTVFAVIWFRNADRLASAYGIAVTGIMLITTLLTMILASSRWRWSKTKTCLTLGAFLIIDIVFFSVNTVKVHEGGWFPLTIAAIVWLIIDTWKKGRAALSFEVQKHSMPLTAFVEEIVARQIPRVPGTAVFMSGISGTSASVPNAMNIHYKHTKAIHERVIFLSIVIGHVPRHNARNRIRVIPLGHQIYQVIAFYGFIEVPNMHTIIDKINEYGLPVKMTEVSFFLSRGLPVSSASPYLGGWQEHLFVFLSHNAAAATEYFKIPIQRVVELGVRFRI